MLQELETVVAYAEQTVLRDNQDENRATIKMRKIDVATAGTMPQAGAGWQARKRRQEAPSRSQSNGQVRLVGRRDGARRTACVLQPIREQMDAQLVAVRNKIADRA